MEMFEGMSSCILQVEDAAIISTSVSHYDSSLPLILACNALQYGVGAVIAHAMLDGSEKPVAFGSKTLSKAEENDP